MRVPTSRPVAVALALLAVACPKQRPPGYLVSAPTEMSVHAAAILEGVIQAEEAPTPAVTVRLLLVPPECRATVETTEPTNHPRVRIQAETAVPCTIALEFDDGAFRQRVDHTVRFLDVPTLLPIDGPHWLNACPGATLADRAGELVACEIGDEVVVTNGDDVVRVPGRLRATDGRGGWVVCTDDTCRIRNLEGEWRFVAGAALAEARWSPLDVPENAFVAIQHTEDGPDRATIAYRDGTPPLQVDSPFPELTNPMHVADGVLVTTSDLSADDPDGLEASPWRAWLSEWTVLQRPAIPVVPTRFEWEPQTIAVAPSGVFVLGIDREARRVLAIPIAFAPVQLLNWEPALGVPGAALAFRSSGNWLDPAGVLVRLRPTGVERLALAPWPEALSNDALAARFVTADALIVTPSDGTPPVRLRVGP